MVAEIKVEGAEKLSRLVKAMKEAGGRGMSRALTKALEEPVGPLKRKVTGSTEKYLPRRLARRVSRARLTHQVRKGKNPKVTIQAKPDEQVLTDPFRADRGRIAHPVYGMPYSVAPWPVQNVKPGWFSQPLESSDDVVVRGIVKVVDEYLQQIEKG